MLHTQISTLTVLVDGCVDTKQPRQRPALALVGPCHHRCKVLAQGATHAVATMDLSGMCTLACAH
jgi:hypothetical protein